MREEYDHHYSGDVIARFPDPKLMNDIMLLSNDLQSAVHSERPFCPVLWRAKSIKFVSLHQLSCVIVFKED